MNRAEALDLPVEQGVLVQSVVEGGPSDEAGLRGGTRQDQFEGALVMLGGDVITAIDGTTVQDMDDLIVYLAGAEVGQTIELTILRDGAEQTTAVTLTERPSR